MNDSKHFLHMGTYAFGARDYFFTSDFKKWFVQNFMSLIPITRGKLKENELTSLQLENGKWREEIMIRTSSSSLACGDDQKRTCRQ